jgi:hypothetical protein
MFKPNLESVKPSLKACFNQSGKPQELTNTFSMHPRVVSVNCQATWLDLINLVGHLSSIINLSCPIVQ